MNRILLWWSCGLVVIVLLVTTVLVVDRDRTDSNNFGSLPWIEVITDDVLMAETSGSLVFAAQTGDELPNGAQVMTSVTAHV